MNFALDDGLAVLDRTPATLRQLLAGVPEPWLRATEGPDTWSPFDIVAHLLGGEETDWIVRARIILAQGVDRRFRPFDRTGMIEQAAGQPITTLLDRLASARADNLATVRGWHLTADQLRLTGEHPEFGTVTLEQLLATWVAHDLGHLAQVARVMARQYREAVGPWRAYLPILG